MKLQITFETDGMPLKRKLQSLIEHLYKLFLNEDHKDLLASVSFINKTDRKDTKERELYWMETSKTMELYDLNMTDST